MTKKKALQLGQIKLTFPNKVEGFLIAGMILLLFLVDIIQNKMQDFGTDYLVTYATAGYTIEAYKVLWIAIALYITFFLLVFARSIWETRATNRKLDLIFGVIGGIGLMFIIAGIIAGFTHKAPEVVSWFYFVPQITFYHIGVLMEIITALYFAITK